MAEGDLFSGLYARGEAAAQVSGTAWLAAMLAVEAALARACAREGLIAAEAAEAIVAVCVPERFDARAIGVEAARHATPVVPLVRALREAVGEPHAAAVHRGATSQDILDTALMIVARRALAPILTDAEGAADGAAALAQAHRGTAMAGRTLLQQALPLPFGLRAAGWVAGLDAAAGRLDQVRREELAVQMGGPVGARAPAIADAVAADLDLVAPVLPWAAIRVRPATLASALGTLAGVVAKIARDVTLLAQQEVGEVAEGGGPERGGSTAMAHKRNPVAAVCALACAKRVPGLVATVLALMEQEHERAAGAWQAEWGTHTELLTLTGSATAWCRELLEGLEVDPARMAGNLERAALPAAGEGGDAGEAGGAQTLIDRALAAHESRRRS
ncbi:MAG: lyase family protein [Solirubrobacteraceae bacterium]